MKTIEEYAKQSATYECGTENMTITLKTNNNGNN